MKLLTLAGFLAPATATATATATVTGLNTNANIKYIGLERNGVEVFLGIPYGSDTGGQNRFKPPKRYMPSADQLVVNATTPGYACPQQLGQWNAPLTLQNTTQGATSEDCLNLNIARPRPDTVDDLTPASGLPVMLWIHGGSFWVGSNMEPTHTPDSLVLNSVQNGAPIIHVAINYRLGVFGFASSNVLKSEQSENAGLRDQRLAIEWVRDNIKYWGGDGNKITIFGQSSGGLAVGLQLLAYGGQKELPYQQGICESQALEPGITGSFARDALTRVADYLDCDPNNATVNAPEVITCLRSKDTEVLFNASAATYFGDIAHNIGDIWLPTVDGDFLPDAPSKLISESRFGNATYMLGWAEGDVNYFTDVNIRTPSDTEKFVSSYLSNMPADLVGELLSLYPVSEFVPPAESNLSSEFYRAARIFRDVLMVCEPVLLAKAMHKKGSTAYFYDFNQTILDPILAYTTGCKGFGVVHTSEFAYIYGLSNYNISGYPFTPTPSDYGLERRASRSWSNFAAHGEPSSSSGETLQGWHPAFWRLEGQSAPGLGRTYVYTIGGPFEGLWPIDGASSVEPVRAQRLMERCAFINDPAFVSHLNY